MIQANLVRSRFSILGMLVLTTLVAIHLAFFATFLAAMQLFLVLICGLLLLSPLFFVGAAILHDPPIALTNYRDNPLSRKFWVFLLSYLVSSYAASWFLAGVARFYIGY